MCYITATELKNNLSHYMELSKEEDVYVTKNNRIVTVLTSPRDKAIKDFIKMGGIFQGVDLEGKTYDELIFEELMKR